MSLSAPSKYRKHNANQLTPKTDRRRGLTSHSDQSRLDPVESTLKAALSSMKRGGCYHNYGWGVTTNTLVIWEIRERPALRHVVSLEGFNVEPESCEVALPWEFSRETPLSCILTCFKSSKIFFIQLETGAISAHPSEFNDIQATCPVEGKGIAVGLKSGIVWTLRADPFKAEWTKATQTATTWREGGMLQAVINMVSYPINMGRFFASDATQGQQQQGDNIVSILYAPGPRRNYLFIVLSNGRIVQTDPSGDADESRVILRDLSEIYDRSSSQCEITAASLSYNRSGSPVLNILVSSVETVTGSKQLSLSRILGFGDDDDGMPIFKTPVSLGYYQGSLSVFVTDSEGSEDEEDPILVLLSRSADRTQVVRMMFGNGETRSSTRILPSKVMASTLVCAPPPEKLTFITAEGWTTEPLPSSSHAAVKRLLTSHHAGGDADMLPTLDLENSKSLFAKSIEITDEPVTDPGQWGALTDTGDRTSHIILRRVREKYSKHRAVVEAAKRAGLEPEKLSPICDNSEKLAVAVGLRELQTRLYGSGGRWQGQELVGILTQFAKQISDGPSSRHYELRLTPLQTVYSEATKLHHIIGFLADWTKAESGAASTVPGLSRNDPQYLTLVAEILVTVVRSVVESKVDTATWTQAFPLLQALRELVSIFHTGALAQDESVRNVLLDSMRFVCQFIIVEERNASILRDTTPAEWIKSLFISPTDADPESSCHKTYGYSLATDIGASVRDFDLLVDLNFMLKKDLRREGLQKLHKEDETALYRSIVNHFGRSDGGYSSALLNVQSFLMLDEEQSKRYVGIVDEVVPEGCLVKYAMMGPNLHTEKEEQHNIDALRRVAGSVEKSIAANGSGTVRNSSHKLKIAKFAATLSTVSSTEIDTRLLLLQVQKEIINSAAAKPLNPETLLNSLLTGPCSSVTWGEASLDDAMHESMHHRLAWAFPLAVICAQQRHGAQYHDLSVQREVWLKALETPVAWWDGIEYLDILDLPEPQQISLLKQTHFYNVYRTVIVHPQLQSSAFRGGKSAVLADLQDNKPEGLKGEMLSLLLELCETE
eukprot:TRINITY_DN662_c10_g1_i1.p1 TRINITY_DN662_c10_g1~~TRINITY_DN662_c10_g1_i1.p1  ORF type:complete len:1080 (+),score=177.25 TRINITY_DN662_c10_g1_i1:70-3240(+)